MQLSVTHVLSLSKTLSCGPKMLSLYIWRGEKVASASRNRFCSHSKSAKVKWESQIYPLVLCRGALLFVKDDKTSAVKTSGSAAKFSQ